MAKVRNWLTRFDGKKWQSTPLPSNTHIVDELTILEALDAAFIRGYELHADEIRTKQSWDTALTPKVRPLDPEIAAAKLRLLQATGQMVDANARLVEHVADTLTDGRRF